MNNEKKKIPARQYDAGFKADAVRLAEKLGNTEAARELGIPDNTLYGWVRAHRNGTLAIPGEATKPVTANRLADEVTRLKAELREANRRLAEEREINEILEKAARFFAVSRKR
jgi:transposase